MPKTDLSFLLSSKNVVLEIVVFMSQLLVTDIIMSEERGCSSSSSLSSSCRKWFCQGERGCSSGQIVTTCGSSTAWSARPIIIFITAITITNIIITCIRSMVGRAGEGEAEQAVVIVPKLVKDCVSRHAKLGEMMMVIGDHGGDHGDS